MQKGKNKTHICKKWKTLENTIVGSRKYSFLFPGITIQIKVLFIIINFTCILETQTKTHVPCLLLSSAFAINWIITDNLNKTCWCYGWTSHQSTVKVWTWQLLTQEVLSSKAARQSCTTFEPASVLKQETKIPHRVEVCALAQNVML